MNADLSALKNIHLPKPVSIWPLAPGWIITIILMVAALLIGSILFRRGLRRYQLRKSILQELDTIKQNYLSKQTPGNATCFHLSKLLKRLLLLKEKREDVASLSGNAWLDAFNEYTFAKVIYDNEYKESCDVDLSPYFDEIKKAIKKKV